MDQKKFENSLEPEEFCNAVKTIVSILEGGTCEDSVTEEVLIGAQLTNKEFAAAKIALLEILEDSSNSPTLRLKAAEHLAALVAAYEQSRWMI